MVVSAVHGAEHFKGLAFSASCLAFESAASCSPSVSEDWQWSMEASCLSPAWWLWMGVQGGAFMCSLITSFYADFKSPLNKQPLLLELALCKEPLYWVVGGVLGFCSEAASARPCQGFILQQLFLSLMSSSCQPEWALKTAAHPPPTQGLNCKSPVSQKH